MTLRRSLLIIILFYACSFSVSASSKPQRIVSLNLCADQLLMSLLPPDRLVGITSLAADPGASFLYQRASDFHQHNNRIEALMALNPDLIVAGEFTAQPTNQLLEQLGYKVVKIGLPVTLDEIFAQIRFLGEQLGEQERAEQLITSMDTTHQRLTMHHQQKPLRAVVYYANGYSAGRQTIVNEILDLAGLNNIAAELALDYVAPLSLESLIGSNPDILILGQLNDNTDSLAHQVLRHKAIHRYASLKQVQKIMIPDRYWSCAGPSSLAAAEYLQNNLTAVSH
ncbi:MAG: ABC transporter substrate-binding protein [Cycloclasticus sp.]|nr:ABC transporter substrate-binding protein [Cycloclasticus sp.]MBQ0789516.1 ABC transporter substrate-binding protein [Cycloclasticus sp.]